MSGLLLPGGVGCDRLDASRSPLSLRARVAGGTPRRAQARSRAAAPSPCGSVRRRHGRRCDPGRQALRKGSLTAEGGGH